MTEILPELRAALRTNYVTFGHSFGAILSYALICDAPRFELPLPLMMLFSGAGAPLVPPTTKPALDRSTLIADMKKMGGTPQEILDDPRFVDAFLPTLRADLEILHLTRLRPSQPLAVPFSTFAGEWDQSVPPQNVRKWEALSTKSTAHHVFEGGHFFLNEVRHQVLNTIATKLTDRLVVQKKDTAGELS
jgi:surfactin synthase thioesterase subunit